jgi:16S rRNA (cytosine1402-N4)-methyltransferase
MTAKPREDNLSHRPVLYHEIIHAIAPTRGKKYVDATLGAGGHARGFLEESSPDGRLLGLDVDPQAIALAKERLASFGDRAYIFRASYTTLSAQLHQLGWESVDGILFDLGASSMQFDTPERGFSFLHDGPLDMRFDPQAPLSAAELLNTWDEEAIANLLYRYGEERRSRRIAQAIIQARPLESTSQLADIVVWALKNPLRSRIHPATRTFQAIRIAVNGELEALEEVLPQAIGALVPGGRLAVISFHSLEDRIVKQFFRQHSQDERDQTNPLAPVVRQASVRLVNRKPITPDEEELLANPRSRSAKLRVIEKISRHSDRS